MLIHSTDLTENINKKMDFVAKYIIYFFEVSLVKTEVIQHPSITQKICTISRVAITAIKLRNY